MPWKQTTLRRASGGNEGTRSAVECDRAARERQDRTRCGRSAHNAAVEISGLSGRRRVSAKERVCRERNRSKGSQGSSEAVISRSLFGPSRSAPDYHAAPGTRAGPCEPSPVFQPWRFVRPGRTARRGDGLVPERNPQRSAKRLALLAPWPVVSSPGKEKR